MKNILPVLILFYLFVTNFAKAELLTLNSIIELQKEFKEMTPAQYVSPSQMTSGKSSSKKVSNQTQDFADLDSYYNDSPPPIKKKRISF